MFIGASKHCSMYRAAPTTICQTFYHLEYQDHLETFGISQSGYGPWTSSISITLLEMQVLRPHPGPLNQKLRGWDSTICFNKPPHQNCYTHSLVASSACEATISTINVAQSRRELLVAPLFSHLQSEDDTWVEMVLVNVSLMEIVL